MKALRMGLVAVAGLVLLAGPVAAREAPPPEPAPQGGWVADTRPFTLAPPPIRRLGRGTVSLPDTDDRAPITFRIEPVPRRRTLVREIHITWHGTRGYLVEPELLGPGPLAPPR